MEIHISHTDLLQAAKDGAEAFATLVKTRIAEAAGGSITAEAMSLLTADQLTLWAYFVLRDEVMDGGFVQLIYNGYGPFFFRNPFGRAMRGWGLDELTSLINKGHKLYDRYGADICRECSDEDFMALFEKFPAFDALDDAFVENEETFTMQVAHYVDEHLENFITIESPEETSNNG